MYNDQPDEVAVAGDLVTQASRLVRTMRQLHAVPAGARVLSILDQHGPLGVSALAELDRCSQPSMTALVRRLADAGLVDKQQHPDDARAALVSLTPTGHDELDDVRRRNGHAVLARLTPDQRDRLEDAVALLRDVVDHPAPAPTEGSTSATTSREDS